MQRLEKRNWRESLPIHECRINFVGMPSLISSTLSTMPATWIFNYARLSSHSGVVNRGDSFRRRRSRSNSLAPGTVQHDSTGDVTKHYRAAPGNGSSGGASTGENVQAIGTDQRSSHQQQHHHQHHSDVRTYRVAIIGSHGVGKSAMVGQFMSSDCINAYDRIRNGKLLEYEKKKKRSIS